MVERQRQAIALTYIRHASSMAPRKKAMLMSLKVQQLRVWEVKGGLAKGKGRDKRGEGGEAATVTAQGWSRVGRVESVLDLGYVRSH
jgi:hypothetical protein